MAATHLGNWKKLSSQARWRVVLLSVWCVRHCSDKSDRPNCYLASPHSKETLRTAEALSSLILFFAQNPSHLILKCLRETFLWRSERKAVKLKLTFAIMEWWIPGAIICVTQILVKQNKSSIAWTHGSNGNCQLIRELNKTHRSNDAHKGSYHWVGVTSNS